jgi:autotransporter-associated beta strand protein
VSRIRNLFRVRQSSRRRRPSTKFTLEQLENRLAPSVNVLEYDYGNTGDTGANTNETQLTPANVNTSAFGKLFNDVLDGQVYATPLVMENLAIGATGGDSSANIVGTTGVQNVVFVGTQHDSLYALNQTTGAIIWHRSFTNLSASYVGTTSGTNINNSLGASSMTSIPSADYGNANVVPEYGILSTPVIDPNSSTLYVNVPTKQTISGVPSWVQQLHAMNINDGTDRIMPFTIGVTTNADGGDNANTTPIWVYGTGDGNVNDPNHATDGNPGTTIVQFNALREMNRPALSFENGQVYVAWASHGDEGPYHGWVAIFNPSSSGFTLTGVFNSSPNDGLSGIWAGGGPIQFEPDGSAFYFETGNGDGGNPTLNAQGFPTNDNYNEALVKMVADSTTNPNHQSGNGWGIKVADYFIPYNVAALDAADADFGSGAPLLLPASAGIPGHPNLLVAAGKSGEIYLVDRNNMGKFDPVNDNVINAVNDGSGHIEPPNLISGSLSTPAYYNGKLYWVSGYSGSAYEYQISSSGIVSTVSQTSMQMGGEPGSLFVTSNGALNGIVWTVDRNLDELHAFSAASLSNELWNSSMNPSGVDKLPAINVFAAPIGADGEVFVPTTQGVVVYGLNQPATAAPQQPTLSAAPLSGSSINLTWTDPSTSPNTATSYPVLESTDAGATFSLVATAPAAATSIAIGGLTPNTTYSFKIQGVDSAGASPFSNVATATTTSTLNGLSYVNGATGLPNVTVSLGYYDTEYGGAFVPSPWQGSANTTFYGSGPAIGTVGWDTGAIKFTNNGTTSVVLSPGVVVNNFQSGASFQLWDSLIGSSGTTIAPGQSLILAQTATGNFDTSDAPTGTTFANRSLIQPQVHFTLNGTPYVLTDTTQVLNQSGWDAGNVLNISESTVWTQNQVISGGFTGASGLTLNGAAAITGGNLVLTNGNTNQASSVFSSTPVDVTGFTSQFTFQSSSTTGYAPTSGEGFTFTIQRVSPNAIGASGAALGYGPELGGSNSGIAQSVALKFDLYNDSGEGADSTGLYIDGAAPTTAGSINLSSTGINFHDGDLFKANLQYDGSTLAVTITDLTTGATTSHNYSIGIVSTIGSTTGYVGFTASTGSQFATTSTASQVATTNITSWSYTPQAATSPNAPSGLGAVPATANSVTLSWTTNSDNQTSFNLDRATDMGFTQNLITENLPATPSSYTDTAAGLAPGGTYYYRIRAFNSAGNSGNSNVANVTIPFPPPAATNPQVLSVTSSEIDLQWTDHAGHNTQGYKIYRSTNSGPFNLVAVLPPTSRVAPDPYGYNDLSVTPGTFYQYEIICYNTSGNNGMATISATSLTMPPNLVYIAQSGTTATLYFTSPPGAVSYKIYRGTAMGAETLLKTGVASSPYVDNTLASGTTYFYYVTAVNANVLPVPNESAPSDEVSPRTGSGTFVWSGGGADANWMTGANWNGGAAPTGNGNETLIFPDGVSQQTNTDNFPSGSNAFQAIMFSGAGYSITVNNPLALGSGGITTEEAGTNTLTAATGAELFLVGSEAFNTASGSILTVSAAIDNAGFTLTVNGSGSTNLMGAISDTGGLTVSGTATLALGSVNTYTGPTNIGSGTTVNAQSGGVLGVNSAVTINGTFNAVTTLGLPGTYYNTAGASDPLDAIGVPAFSTPANLLAYAAALPVIATDNSANFPQPGPNNWNNNGAYFDYGEDGNATNQGFPAAVVTATGGNSFLGIWSGQFYAPVAGVYDFGTSSDDGSAIYVDGTLVVDNNNYQGMTFRDSNNPFDTGATTAPTLTAGPHNILIAFYEGGGGYGLYATVTGPAGSGLTGHLLNSSLSPAFITTIQVGSLSGSGKLNMGVTPLSVGSNNASTTFSGNITGSGNYIKTGAGVLTLSGAEAFTGNWTINGGQLILGTTATPISGENMASITNNTTNPVVINNPSGNTFTLNANISGTGGLTLNGTGTYNLGGASTFTAATVIPAGAVVNASGSSPLGTGDVTLPAGSTLNVGGNTFGTGLPVTWYGWGGASPRQNPPAASLSVHPNILDYAATQGLINDGIANETSAYPNITNLSGSLFEYGGNSGRNTQGGNGNGFPAAVQSNNSNGSSIMGIWQGLFFAPTTGVYDFATGSDDGSVMYVDGNLVVDNNNDQGYTIRDSNNPFDAGATTAPTLTAGVHTILIEFYNGGGGYNFDAFVNGTLLTNSQLGVPTVNLVVGSLTGGGTVNLGTNGISIGSDNHSTTFTGTINGTPTTTGGPNLTKAGTGTLILPTPAQFNITGGLAITGGTLQIGNGTAALPATLPYQFIQDNGTLVLNGPNGSSVTYNGNISGSGGLTQQGVWTLTLGGNNSYSGPTIITAGSTVNATSSTALGSGDLNLVAGSTLNVLASSTPNLGTGLPGQYYSISGDGLPDGRMNSVGGINAMIAQYGASGPIATDTSAFTTANGQGQTNTNNNGATFNYGSGSTGATTTAGFPTVVKTTNSGGNSIFGVWTGIFFAAVSGTYVFDTASNDGTTLFIDGNLVVNNNFQQGVTTRQGAVNLSAGPHNIEISFQNGGGGYGLWVDVQLPGSAGFQRLPNSLLGTVSPTLLQLGSLSGGGTINLAPNASVPNNGLNVGTDNNSTTFTGTINSPGTTIPNFPNLVKSGTGTFILPTGEGYTGGTAIGGGVLQLGTSTSSVSSLPTSGIIDNGNLTVFLPNNTSLTYSGVISGSGGLTIKGQGDTITLGGVNTYAGPTLVGANKIVQGVANALPPVSAITLGAGSLSGQIDLNGFNGSIGSITAAGTGTGNALTNSKSTTVTLALNGTGSFINVNVPITGPINLIVNGIGTEILSAANTYTGNTVVNGSTLIAANNAALPNGGALTVSGSGVLDLDGHNLTVSSLSGVGTTNTITNSSTTPATLTITGSAGGFYTGAVTGPVSIVDAGGASALTVLAGGPGNTFSGGVTATSGSLAGLPGSFGSAPITLNGGRAVLEGSQQVVGFGSNGVGWTVNKNAAAAGISGAGGFGSFGSVLPAANTWQATTAANNEATDLIYDTPVQPNNGFTVSFTYLDNSPGNATPADGVTFLLEADPQGPFALGGGGGSFGYGGGGTGSNPDGSIKSSMAVALNIYTGAAGGRGTAVETNGAINGNINPGGGFGILTSGHPISVVLTYNAAAQILVETVTDTVTGAGTFSDFYGINLFSLLGSPNAFIGFSGATGGSNAQQFLSNFTYLGASGAVTAFSNSIQASAGTTSTLAVQANALANAYSTSGGLTVPATATVNIAPDQTSTANQAYSLAIGGSTTLGGSLNIANNGTANGTLILGGPLSGVGTTIGAISGSGTLSLAAASTYNVVLGGTGAGQFDNLSVSGPITLSGGNLALSYANSFSPAVGQSFTILHSAKTLTGTFGQGSTISAGNATYSISYSGGNVVLTVTSVVAPTHLVVNAPSTATAGTAFNLTVSAQDSAGNTAGGFSGVVTLNSSAGADLAPTAITLANGSATIPVTLTKAGSQTLTASFSGLTSGTASLTVGAGAFSQYLVSTQTGGTSVTAGDSFLVKVQAADQFGNPVASYSGPVSVTASVSPASVGSSFPTMVSLSSTGIGFGLGTLQQTGTYTITASSGTFTGSAAPLTVVPGPAAKLGFGTQPANTPTGVTLPPVTVQVQDQYGNVITSDNSDQVKLGIASGPGSFLPSSTLMASVVNGVATFSGLALVVPGSYTLSAQVPTLFTGPNSNSFTIAPLQMLPGSFSSSPSGFSLQFNAPFLVNSTTPVLFGPGFGAGAPAPSVTLTGPGGLVEGSLVLNTATNSITFVETNTASQVNNTTPILPDGAYTVVVHGTAAGNGFQALNAGGGYLDGTNSGTPGHDFTTTFTIGAAAAGDDIVWTPATANGPKQTLQAPGNNVSGGGYPVYLNDGSGLVTSVNVTFNYNPAMLSVTGVTSNPNLPGSTFALNVGLSSPGHTVLSYTGPKADASSLVGGQVPLGFISATVPDSPAASPIYKGKDLLHLSGISVNGGTIAAVGNDAVHVVAFVGDANGDGTYSSDDAVKITRVALQTDAGFAAYPLVDPVIVADTDGSGFIPADAALQVNEVGVGFPATTVAPLPNPVNTAAIGNNVDPALTLPANLQANAQGVVSVPVLLDDAHPEGSTGLIRGHLALTYDSSRFTVTTTDVHPGSLLAGGGWSVAPSIDPTTGQIGITFSSSTPLADAVGGSLVTIDFHGAPVAYAPGSPSIALVAFATINGQDFATELEDAQGTFTLSSGGGTTAQVALRESPTSPLPTFRPSVEETLRPMEAAGIAAHPAESVVRETLPALMPPVVEEASEPAEPTLPHAGHGISAVVSSLSSTSTSATAFLLGAMFQVAGVNPAAGLLPGWQRLTDQLFQVLGRTPTNSIEPTVLLRDSLERTLLPAPYSLDDSPWEEMEMASTFNGPLVGAWSTSTGPRSHPAVSQQTTPSPASTGPLDQAAVDRAFAQTDMESDAAMDLD